MSAHGRLEGRVEIVTGAAGGMGAAHVTRLAGEGATVYAADIHKEGLKRTTAATPDRTRGRLLDVTSADAWSALVTDVMTHRTARPASASTASTRVWSTPPCSKRS